MPPAATPSPEDGGGVSLSLPAAPAFVAPAAHLVEGIGAAFGMPAETARALALASEEVIAFVAGQSAPGGRVTLDCRDRRYRMSVEISLPAAGFDPRMFNLTQAVSPEAGETDLDHLGLLLAARMVDEFAFVRDGGRIRLLLHKLRPYPRLVPSETAAPPPEPSAPWHLAPATPERLGLLARLAAGPAAPAFLAQPGRLADMVAVGDLDGLVAQTADGAVLGGALWQPSGRIVELFGPWRAAGAPAGIETALVEACLIAVARGPALGVISRVSGPDFPADWFERLGNLAAAGGARPVLFRQLHEDPGAVSWAGPDLTPFLAAHYAELGLPRRLVTPAEGGPGGPSSVLSAVTRREEGSAVLRPALAGADCADNIARHCRHLERSGFADLRGEIDLGQGWQAGFVPGLLAAGFVPRFVIPHGGEGDLLVLQRPAPAERGR